VPPRVEYELTAMGRSLIKPLADLCHWAKAHIRERDDARGRFHEALEAPEASPSKRALMR
jgi:DNA-binding HxlR family transcriptional regulator